MGEMSEYFEDFPEENPANWVNGKFDPEEAQALRDQKSKVAKDSKLFADKIAAIAKKHQQHSHKKFRIKSLD